MKDMHWYEENIEEELHDAEKYAKSALYTKHTDAEASRLCAELARQELNHADMLHGMAVKTYNRHADAGEDMTATKAIWDHYHKKAVEQRAKVHALLAGL